MNQIQVDAKAIVDHLSHMGDAIGPDNLTAYEMGCLRVAKHVVANECELPQSYESLAQRTEAPITPELLERLQKAEHLDYLRILSTEIKAAEITADALKRYVFYGKEGYIEEQPCCPPEGEAPPLWRQDEARLLHAALGKVTEASELLSGVFELIRLRRYEPDVSKLIEATAAVMVNIKEETGDSRWYDAIISNVLNTPLSEIDAANIRKLQKRYGDKFDNERAINRDLDAENKALAE